MELVKASTYLENLDISLVRRLERLVSIYPSKKKIEEARKLINIYINKSKVAYFYQALTSPSYKENEFTKEIVAILSYGKGDLFCDYLLQKHAYYAYGCYNYNVMAEIKKALKELIKDRKSYDAVYLYSDLLILEGNPKTEEEAFDNFLVLAREGHAYSCLSLALIIIASGEEYKASSGAIVPFLSFAAQSGIKQAQIVLLDVLKNGFDDMVQKDPRLAEQFEKAFENQSFDTSQLIFEKYYREGAFFNESNEKAVELLPLIGRTPNNNHYGLSLYRKYLKEKEDGLDYKDSLNKAYKELYSTYKYQDYDTLVALSNIFFNEEPYLDRKLGFNLLLDAYRKYPNPDISYTLYRLIKSSDEYKDHSDMLPELSYRSFYYYIKKDINPFIDHYYNMASPSDGYKYARKLLSFIKKYEPEFSHAELAYIYLKEGKKRKAKKEFNKVRNYVDVLKYPYTYAKLYENLPSGELDFLKAINLYKAASVIGNSKASYTLGRYYEKGLLIAKNLEESVNYYKLAARQGITDAYFKAGYVLIMLGHDKAGLAELETGASLSNSKCANALGDLYFYGQYVEKDYTKAAHWYSEGSKNKDPRCMFKLGIIFKDGLGYKKDLEKARELFELSKKYGYRDGLFKLFGKHLYENNDKECLRYLNLAYEAEGDRESLVLLSKIYSEGKITGKRPLKARKYLLLSKATNDPESLFKLGLKTSGKSRKLKYFEDAYMYGYTKAISYAGIWAYKNKEYQKAYSYLSNGLSEEIPETYYIYALLHMNNVIKNLNSKDALYYMKKAAELKYQKAVLFLRGE